MNLYEEMKSARMIAMKTHNKNESTLLSVLIGEIERGKLALTVELQKDDSKINSIVESKIKMMISNATENYKLTNSDEYKIELDILSVWNDKLPKKLSEDDTKLAVETIISDLCEINIGKIMGALKQKYGNLIDMKIAKTCIDSINKL
jgi:uncharacterized protein YqeY